MFRHLLGPLGVPGVTESLRVTVESYLAARGELEWQFAIRVPQELEREVLPVVWRVSN
jgi:hypothetical protein